MFNIGLSIALVAAPIALYLLVIRPRLKAAFTDTYADLDSFWARVWARTYAFRTYWIATFGAFLAAAPDILVRIAPLDFSTLLPQPWGGYCAAFVAIAIPLMKAFETKPDGMQP